MSYSKTDWKDHVVSQQNRYNMVDNSDGTVTLVPVGTIIQQGTNMSAQNFNHMELGIDDAHMAQLMFAQYCLQRERLTDTHLADVTDECVNEVQTVTLTNTLKYPFNNSVQSVSLIKPRQTLNYNVSAEVVSASGSVGNISVTDKQLNGFKVSYDGSSTSVVLKIRVRGGILV